MTRPFLSPPHGPDAGPSLRITPNPSASTPSISEAQAEFERSLAALTEPFPPEIMEALEKMVSLHILASLAANNNHGATS